MAEPQQAGPQPLKFPLGINNRDREYALPDGALREATNLAVTRDGGLISRKGLREVLSGDCHSLYTPPHGRFVLVVKDGQLSRFDGAESLTTLVSVNGPVVYASLNDEVYWTDGTVLSRVLFSGELGIWGMNSPPEPLCTAVTHGGLYEGEYQVAMTAVHPSGLESGAIGAVSVVVAAGGGIQVTVPSANGVQFALYRTGAQGGQDELRWTATVNPGATVLLGVGNSGKPLESLHVTRPLPGQCLIQHKGRLWSASNNVVWFTEAKSPHWLRPDLGYFQVESTVTLLAAVEDGVYVGTASRVYFLQGNDPYKATQRPVSSVGAAAGTLFEPPYDLFLGDGSFPTRQASWWDVEGNLCIGKPGGIVVRPVAKHFVAGETLSGIMTYHTSDGLRQLIASLDARVSSLQAVDVSVTEVFANGVVLGQG